MSKAVKKPEPSSMARRVRARMLVLGMSQGELARRTDSTPVFVSEFIRGVKETLRSDKLALFATALGVGPEYLLGTTMLRLPRPSPGPRVLSPEEVADLEQEEARRLEEDEAARHEPLPRL